MNKKKALLAAAAACAAAAVAALWLWKTWLTPPAALARDPLPDTHLPESSVALSLENYLPDGAQTVVVFPRLEQTFAAFRQSPLYAQYDALNKAAQAKAEAAFPIKGPQAPADSPLDWLMRTVGRGLALAGYPVIGARQRLLMLALVPADFTFAGTPLEPLVKADPDDVVDNVPLHKVGGAGVIALAPAQNGQLLLVGTDVELVKSAVSGAQPLGRQPWVQSAARFVPAGSFLYSLSRPQGIGYADWSVLSMSWDKGLHYRAYVHFAADMPDDVRKSFEQGPAGYPALAWLPADGFFFLAVNSLSLRASVKTLRDAVAKQPQVHPLIKQLAAIDWSPILDQLEGQAAMGMPGIRKTIYGVVPDVFFAAQVRSALKLRLGLGKLLRSLPDVQVSDVALKSGSCYAVVQKDQRAYACASGRWLLVTRTQENMDELLAKVDGPPIAWPSLPIEHAPKSNALGFIDAAAVARSIRDLTPEGPAKERLSALTEALAPFQAAGFEAVYEKGGATTWLDQPYKDLSPAEWAAKLAPFAPLLDRAAMATQQRTLMGTMTKNLAMLRVALYKYHQARGRYPPSLRALVPKYLKIVPANPMTGRSFDYSPRTGQLSLPAPAQASNPTLDGLNALRRAVMIFAVHFHRLPSSFSELVALHVLPRLPLAQTGSHQLSATITPYPSRDPSVLRDTGGWGVVSDPNSRERGLVFIDCTHTGPGGKPWYQY